jgi:hypothetical protein
MKDALYRAFAKRSPRQEAKPLTDRLALIEKRAGSVKEAARQAGVSPTTWRRWRRGVQTPKAASLGKVTAAQRRQQLPAGRKKRLKASGGGAGRMFAHRPSGGFTLTGTVVVSSDERTRTLNLSRAADPETLDRLATAWADGDDETAGQIMADVLAQYFGGQGAHVLSVDSIDFGPLR